MPLLFSNFPPLRTEAGTYNKTFKDLLELSDSIDITSGYISADSAIDLKNIIEVNGGPRLNLCVGMHYFDGLTPTQLFALQELDRVLRNSDLGSVFMVTTFPVHAKVASFSKNGEIIGSIIGSSNLSNIVFGQRQYEADYLIDNQGERAQLKQFIEDAISKASKPLHELEISPILPKNDLLKDQLGVESVSKDNVADVRSSLSGLSFTIPLKGDVSQKSGLNASFGEGRRNQQGFVVPRSWYEVELIVPKSITTQDGYPQADSDGESGSFTVITDDGWKFNCKVSGDYSKNFRSEDDLKVLGKWIKGRLENKGVLKPGERVTDEVLATYGRSDMQFTKINGGDNQWYLDFGV